MELTPQTLNDSIECMIFGFHTFKLVTLEIYIFNLLTKNHGFTNVVWNWCFLSDIL